MKKYSQIGSGSVLSIALVFAILFLVSVLAVIIFCFSQISQCKSTADLSAINAATSIKNGEGNPCAIANSVVKENNYVMSGCVVENDDVRVEIEKNLFSWMGDIGTIRAKAKAGPSRQCSK